MEEFEQAFNKLRTEMGFTPTLEALDEIFFLTDHIQQLGFVSNQLSRTVCSRIVDTYNNWIGAFHDWVMPNQSSMISMEQSNTFSEEEKKELINLIKKFMAFLTRNIVIGITKDKDAERQFINDAVTIWNDNLPAMTKFSKKLQAHWES